jgi:NADPH:quinone reductase-like Zn-dependent oxidoreductase
MSAMPSSQRAVISVGPGELALKEGLPVPNVEDDMTLVKTKCVALNPADYKMSDFSSSASGAIYGNDFSGIITSVPGSSLRNRLNVGDRVCGMVFGADQKCPNNGAFAEYVAATGDLLVKIPQEMSFEDAATIGVGTTTAGLALYQSLGLPMPDKPASKPFHVLVYGGSTATGTIAIQLVKLCVLARSVSTEFFSNAKNTDPVPFLSQLAHRKALCWSSHEARQRCSTTIALLVQLISENTPETRSGMCWIALLTRKR